MTEAALLKMRAKNAKLMNGNLALLMNLRETEADIDALREKLWKKRGELEERGVPVPASCVALLDKKARAGYKNKTARSNATMGRVAATPAAGPSTAEARAGAALPQPTPAPTQFAASKFDIKALVSEEPRAQLDS